MHSGQQIPGNALVGGADYDQQRTLYVCRAYLHGGLHPGKLLNGNCNVSFGGSGTEYHQFDVAVKSGGPGHWAPWDPRQTAIILLGGHEAGGAPLYVCHANYIVHSKPFFGIFGSEDTDHGVHPGKLVGGKCDFEWGSHEIAGTQYVQVFYLTPPPAPPRQVPPPPPGHKPPAAASVWTLIDQWPQPLQIYAFQHARIPGFHFDCHSFTLRKVLNNGDTWQIIVPADQILEVKGVIDDQGNGGCSGNTKFTSAWDGAIPGTQPPIYIN